MFVIIIWEAKTLYFLVFHRVMLVATYCKLRFGHYWRLSCGKRKNQNIDKKKKKWRRCHIRRALATVANRKCGPENILRRKYRDWAGLNEVDKHFCKDTDLQNYTKTVVKRIINPFIFQNNFQFSPLRFLHSKKRHALRIFLRIPPCHCEE